MGDRATAGAPGRGTHDEVDRIVAAWRVARPDLEVTPFEVFSRVSRLARLLDLARGEAFATHGLDGWEFDVLSALRRAGEPWELSPGQLVSETLVTSGTMTNRVDRLERRGLVERRPAEGDRRGVIVRLTQEGRALVDGAVEDLLTQEDDVLSVLDPAERAGVADALRRLLLSFEE